MQCIVKQYAVHIWSFKIDVYFLWILLGLHLLLTSQTADIHIKLKAAFMHLIGLKINKHLHRIHIFFQSLDIVDALMRLPIHKQLKWWSKN